MATTTTTLPRPSRPSTGPPNAPLPSLPIPRSRKASVNSIASTRSAAMADPVRLSVASIAPSTTITAPRSVSSTLPARSQLRTPSASSPNLPALGMASKLKTPNGVTPPSAAAAARRDRTTLNLFPQPPKSPNYPHSPLSANTFSNDDPLRRESASSRTPGRLAGKTTPSSLKTPSKTIFSVSSDNLAALSSPPGHDSSAAGSYANSATTADDIGDDVARGRETLDSPATDRAGAKRDGKGNVLVSVRVRPEAAAPDGKTEQDWLVDGRRSLIAYRGREGGDYYYDNVFTTHDNNARVYDAAAKRLVRRVMEGYHGTVFAYGMTGTGKTFSMQGTASSPGVIPLAITDIFAFIRETPHREFLLRVSYLEIYNEKINDLLSGPTANGQNTPQEEIKLREDSKRGVYATPLKEEIVQSPTQLLRVIARGDNSRRVGSTQFNARSSRSHAVVQIVVESRERVPGTPGTLQEGKRAAVAPGGVRVSTLSLIDLAGSEKAAENKERRTEGAHINKSLLTLGTVIANLSGEKKENGASAGDKPTRHLPFRDSKLTRLLQPALSGNSLVSILCTIQIGAAGSVATASNHTNETINTLKFASRAKNNIVSHAKRAEEAHSNPGDPGSRALLDRYKSEIQDLRKQLEAQTAANKAAKDEEEERAREMEAEHRHEEQMLEMQLARTALKERIEHLNRLILSSKSIGVNSGRSFSSMSLQRGSAFSPDMFQHRSSTRSSAATLEVPAPVKRTSSSSTTSISNSAAVNHAGVPSNPEAGSGDDEDSVGENGDGTATQAVQIRALQADLADRNRYIGTLEKRLLQARRSSQSRVSLAFSNQRQLSLSGEEGGVEQLLREKDQEIADLRARLDDKERMVSALRSAARKRDIADLSIDTTPNTLSRAAEGLRTTSSAGSRRVSVEKHRPRGSNSSVGMRNQPMSPIALLTSTISSPAPAIDGRNKSVDEVTRMLDEMITKQTQGQERIDSGVIVGGRRSLARNDST